MKTAVRIISVLLFCMSFMTVSVFATGEIPQTGESDRMVKWLIIFAVGFAGVGIILAKSSNDRDDK